MTQMCCYRVWDGSLERFRKGALLMAFIDLVVICSVILYTGISLYNVSFVDTPEERRNLLLQSDLNATDAAENVTQLCFGDATESQECQDNVLDNQYNQTLTGKLFPVTPYFQVVGHQIAKSIQLIIYTCELFVTILLIRGLMWTDTHSMRTWLIVTEIITTIILLVLVLYLFGNFKTATVVILTFYLIYQVIMIRTVSRLIRRTEIELTQFGSIVEF